MQIPILSGIYTDQNSDFRTSYPRNLIPVPKENGVANGYLRPAEGIVQINDVPGVDRGGINWNGICYRVCGDRLIKISDDGTVTVIGEVGGTGFCNFDYSFDYLAINSKPYLYLYNNSMGIKRIVDVDLGDVNDVIWVDGYFMTTDGSYLIITELNDPFQVNPLKYGSSEVDPDPINALFKLRNEVYALNRYTIEVFSNVGGDNFPFSRIDGAMSTRGTLAANTCCLFLDTIAFLGSGKNEPISIYLSANGTSQKIATREIDQILRNYTEDQLTRCLVESRILDGHQWLYIHLPDKTLVYDAAASQATNQQVWFFLCSGFGENRYLAQNHVWCYDKWIVGHPEQNKIGTLTNKLGEHWGEVVEWVFSTSIIYNESHGAIFHQLELVSLSGRAIFGESPAICTQYSIDGIEWSNPKYIAAGKTGQRDKRLVWFQQGHMNNWRIQKFTGTSESRLSISRLEAQIEPLGV
ncbi:packaged DNA stabilization protein [Acinetobacter baumannii]|uniref:packaged DNA stabilization protein n=1 Tax=Acinetobacter baumannii TaxID=470 RepID=UPI0024B7919D|nr:packaged DNA stabilization protein [Acinetobacter baumannii]MDI9751213.1 packaged DNA stabilization protein [Acinetobacter baumannii]